MGAVAQALLDPDVMVGQVAAAAMALEGPAQRVDVAQCCDEAREVAGERVAGTRVVVRRDRARDPALHRPGQRIPVPGDAEADRDGRREGRGPYQLRARRRLAHEQIPRIGWVVAEQGEAGRELVPDAEDRIDGPAGPDAPDRLPPPPPGRVRRFTV